MSKVLRYLAQRFELYYEAAVAAPAGWYRALFVSGRVADTRLVSERLFRFSGTGGHCSYRRWHAALLGAWPDFC